MKQSTNEWFVRSEPRRASYVFTFVDRLTEEQADYVANGLLQHLNRHGRYVIKRRVERQEALTKTFWEIRGRSHFPFLIDPVVKIVRWHVPEQHGINDRKLPGINYLPEQMNLTDFHLFDEATVLVRDYAQRLIDEAAARSAAALPS